MSGAEGTPGAGGVDTLGFGASVAGLPEQFAVGLLAGAPEVDLSPVLGQGPLGAIDRVAVCGMGGSGISGDVLAAAGAPSLTVPVTVVKGYELPAFSGRAPWWWPCRTPEAPRRPSKRPPRVSPRAPGSSRSAPVGGSGRWPPTPAPVVAPPGRFMPRAALGHLASPLFVILERLGILPGATA